MREVEESSYSNQIGGKNSQTYYLIFFPLFQLVSPIARPLNLCASSPSESDMVYLWMANRILKIRKFKIPE